MKSPAADTIADQGKKLLAVLVNGPGDTFFDLARSPSALPAYKTVVVSDEEDRVDFQTAVMLHKHHGRAFQEFPAFATDEWDPTYGMDTTELRALTKDNSIGLDSLSKGQWPWRNTDPGVTFDAGVAMSVGKENAKVIVITMAAERPMINLAWLWALHTKSIRVSPFFVIRQPMLIMAIDPHLYCGTQVEVGFPDEQSRKRFPMLRILAEDRNLRLVLAVPKTIDAWMNSAPGLFAPKVWSEYALFSLVKLGGRAIYRPEREDEMLQKKLGRMEWGDTLMGSSSLRVAA